MYPLSGAQRLIYCSNGPEKIEFLDAVDMAYSAAEFSGLVSRYGDDLVQATLALAFMDIPRRAA
jgi:hypothetical protein